jgi:hypothetical protein
MEMFVSDDTVPVTIDGKDIVYVRALMDVATRNRVSGLASKVRPGHIDEQEVDMGLRKTALLENNILKWEGPSFDGVPCVPHNIRRLHPKQPIVDLVLEKINELNFEDEDQADPNSSEPSGETPLEVSTKGK